MIEGTPRGARPEPEFTVAQLNDLITLLTHIQGVKPSELKISKEYREYFIKERHSIAGVFNLQKDSNITELSFRGVKLL